MSRRWWGRARRYPYVQRPLCVGWSPTRKEPNFHSYCGECVYATDPAAVCRALNS